MTRTGIFITVLILFSSLRSEIGEPNHKVPLFLSMIFPGGGQIYNGRYIKAGIYAALEGVLIYGALKQNQRMEDAKEELFYYRKIGDQTRINEYEYYVNTYTNERNNFIWMSIAAVLLSAGDAYVDSHFKSFKRDVFSSGDEISVGASYNGLNIMYKW